MVSKAEVTCFFEKETSTAQYIVVDPQTKHAAIIDSVLDYNPASGGTSTKTADEIIQFVKQHNLTVDWILETHAHADHITAATYLKKQLGGKVAIGEYITKIQNFFKGVFHLQDLKTDGSQFDHLFKDGEKFKIGELEVNVMHTPGHTPACISYYIKNDCIFVGDTVFLPDMGTARCDFPMGSVDDLWNSIHKIYSLPDETKIFTCHDYGQGGRPFAWESTVGEEKSKNIHVNTKTVKEEFVDLRKKRDASLGPPRLIIPSIQVNVDAGFFPQPDSNGIVYLKTPVNVLGAPKSSPGVFTSTK